MILQGNLTLEEKQQVAKIFGEELKSWGEWWIDSSSLSERIEHYLATDLERFPQIIHEEMIRKGAKVE